ncbi:unnamed protein product [Notodromas monacha]|uniref:Barrier-to-autointegration factor-like protein n=1 Tax=Notodromas monacha TaxID=399045 RepID=A0A7R9BG83_9CRUS|nr:unnamed protein product [Notodromas monacha]CAG0913294.1 unnamed protein product [Notodromas monacha]
MEKLNDLETRLQKVREEETKKTLFGALRRRIRKPEVMTPVDGDGASLMNYKQRESPPLSPLAGNRSVPKMSTSQKLRNFVTEPMGDKPVTAVAGIGEVLGDRLVAKGYDKAYVLFGQFLVFKKDEDLFQMWLKDEIKANSKQATDCFTCLKEWADQNIETLDEKYVKNIVPYFARLAMAEMVRNVKKNKRKRKGKERTEESVKATSAIAAHSEVPQVQSSSGSEFALPDDIFDDLEPDNYANGLEAIALDPISSNCIEDVADVVTLSVVYDGSAEESAPTERSTTPLPLPELLALHQNIQLERNDFFVSSFVASQARVDREPLFELVSAYLTSRSRLIAAVARAKILKEDSKKFETQAWSVERARSVIEDECIDGAKVYGVREFTVATFDHDKGKLHLSAVLRKLRTCLYENHSLYLHLALVARLRIEAHLERIIESLSLNDASDLKQMPDSNSSPSCPASSMNDMNAVRSSISVLFSFIRLKHKDDVFVNDVKCWLDRIVSVFLKFADKSDYLFLLNHGLRCPAGTGKWTARFIICPPIVPIDPNCVVTPAVDHAIVMLSTILNGPVRARKTFLAALSVDTSGDELDDNWTLLDDEDEESADRDPVEFLESDLLAFIARIPFYDLIRQLLGVIGNEEAGKAVVLPSDSDNFMKSIAVTTRICEILRSGMSTYTDLKYRNLGKLLCRFLSHLAQFMNDYFEVLQKQDLPEFHTLQGEYDAFFERVFMAIRSAKICGGWQFLSQLNYKNVSLIELHQLKKVALCVTSPSHFLEAADEDRKKNENGLELQGLDEILGILSESDSFYIMAAIVKMAASRPSKCGGEKNFLSSVILDVLKVGFLDAEHQVKQSKPCRDLLSSLSTHHPMAMSIILRELIRNISSFDELSLYLVRDLPWDLWKPDDEDVHLLAQCVTNSGTESWDSQCARLIISRLNYGVDRTSNLLFLDREVHRKIASALVACHMRHASYSGPRFDSWAWETLRSLKLHIMHVPQESVAAILDGDHHRFHKVPELEGCSCEDWLLSVKNGCEANEPMAHCVALLATDVGHSVPLLISRGFNFLTCLAGAGMGLSAKKTLVFILDAVLPLFYSCPGELRHCSALSSSISGLLFSDSHYLNLAKGLIVNVPPGPILSMLLATIRRRISIDRENDPGNGPTGAVLTWFEILTSSCESWWTNSSVLRLLDALCEGAIFCDAAWKTWEVLCGKIMHLQKEAPVAKSGRGIQLLQWVRSSGASCPPLMPKWPLPEYPWYALTAMRACVRLEEEDSGFFKALCLEMVADPGISVDVAFKRTHQVASNPSEKFRPQNLQSVSIYRWAQQAIACCGSLPDAVCPTLPFLMQEFSSKYFYRITDALKFRGIEHASVGFKFFEDHVNFSILKNLKRKLNDAKAVADNKALGDSCYHDETLDAVVFKDLKYWKNVSSVLDASGLWLEEKMLHDMHVYLDALPPRFLRDKLEALFSGDRTPWYCCLDLEQFEWLLNKETNDWTVMMSGKRSSRSKKQIVNHSPAQQQKSSLSSEGSFSDLDPASRIITRLRDIGSIFTHSVNLAKIAEAGGYEQRVGFITGFSPGLLASPASVAAVIEPRIRILNEQAEFHAKRCAEHIGLDANFIEDLLPKLYNPVEKSATVVATCRDKIPPGIVPQGGVGSSLRGIASAVKLRPSQGSSQPPCRGPVQMVMKYVESVMNEAIGYQISQNRKDWEIMIRQALEQPPEEALQAGFILSEIVSSLCDARENPWGDDHFARSGLTVFYCLIDGINPDLEGFPPTRQLFSSLVEKLGQTFVCNRVEECRRLLDKLLLKPTLLGLLAPHWSMVASAQPEIFVPVYKRVLLESFRFDDSPDLPFVLLSKCDLKTWLPRVNPALEYVERLMEAQMSCLSEEPAEDSKRDPAYALVRRHFRHCIAWNFPCGFRCGLEKLLQASRSFEAPIGMWFEFLAAILGASQVHGPNGGMDASIDAWGPVWRNFAQQQSGLSLCMISETIHYLGRQMEEDRTGGMSTYGLYASYRKYVKPLACLFGLLANAFIISSLHADAGSLSGPLLKSMWQEIIGLFRYWICPATLPYLPQDTASAPDVPSLPWVPADAQLADHMLAAFVSAVALLHETVPASHSALSILWEWYVQTFANTYTKPHVFSVVHSRLSTLPWRSFWPGCRDVELMTKLSESYMPDCHAFLGSIFVRICWSDVLNAALDQPVLRGQSPDRLPPKAVTLVSEYFGLLSEFLLPLLTQADQLPLSQCVDQITFEKLVHWFLLSCDAKIVLDIPEKDFIDFQTYKLLEAASGIRSKRLPVSPTIHSKCRLFIRAYVRLLLSCHSKYKALFAASNVAVRDSVRRVAGLVEMRCRDSEEEKLASALIDELLVAAVKLDAKPNTPVTCEGQFEVGSVEQGFMEWISSNDWQTGILKLVLSSLGRLVTAGAGSSGVWRYDAAASLGRLLEAALSKSFCSDASASRDESEGLSDHWDEVSSVVWKGIGNPGADFWRIVASEGCLLLSYSVCRFKRPVRESHLETAKDCVSWAEEAKNCLAMEPKFFLMWDEVLESLSAWRNTLGLSDLAKGRTPDARELSVRLAQEREVLSRLTGLTLTMSEERASGGFMGAIGLGKRSQFSSEFRFICACLAAVLTIIRVKNNGLDHAELQSQKKLHSLDGWKRVLLENKAFAPFAESATWLLDYLHSIIHPKEIDDAGTGLKTDHELGSAGPLMSSAIRKGILRKIICGFYPVPYLTEVFLGEKDLTLRQARSRLSSESDRYHPVWGAWENSVNKESVFSLESETFLVASRNASLTRAPPTWLSASAAGNGPIRG